MGSYAIMTDRRMFAFRDRVGIALELDPESGGRLVARAHAEPFLRMGRRFGDWIWMPARTPGEKNRVAAALERPRHHVRTAPPKSPPRRGKPIRRRPKSGRA